MLNVESINRYSEIYERLIKRLSIDSNGCWLFDKVHSSGYSFFGIGRSKAFKAHRVSYEIHKGPIPKGLHIDHLCSVKHCCNPDHLEAVTGKENTRRAWDRGEAKLHSPELQKRIQRQANAAAAAEKRNRTHCIRGHEFSDENTRRDINGGRHCKECNKIRGKLWYEKSKC